MEPATRSTDSQVHPITENHTDTYGWGLNRFLHEARTLVKFRHPGIVRVLSVFEANNSARTRAPSSPGPRRSRRHREWQRRGPRHPLQPLPTTRAQPRCAARGCSLR